jgi:hypothetical protein
MNPVERQRDGEPPRVRVSSRPCFVEPWRAMFKRLLLPLVLALAFAPGAQAAGGRYVFDGGTRAEQGQVTAALNASSFNWSVVPGPIVIHIGNKLSPHAVAGQIWLDAGLLAAGRISWGVVQHEYAHQVDFSVLTDEMRTELHGVLQGTSWWGSISNHAQLDCELFADTLAWAYWQSPDNVMKPDGPGGEGGHVAPAAFRSALDTLLNVDRPRTTAAVHPRRHPRNG